MRHNRTWRKIWIRVFTNGQMRHTSAYPAETRAANEALFTRKRNAAIKGFEAFVVEQDLQGKDLKCLQTAVSSEEWRSPQQHPGNGPVPWMRRSITPPALTASSGPDVAVVSSSSVNPEPARAPRAGVSNLIPGGRFLCRV